MWWLGLTVFTSVLAAPIQEPAAVSCLSFTDGECYSFPKGCSSCKAVVKITGNVYEFTTQLAAPDHDVAALKIIETNGDRHVVVCSPTNNTANSYEDQKSLVPDVTNLVTYLDGKATTEHLTCKVELSLVFNGTGSFYVSSGSTVDGQLLFALGQRVGQQIDEVHGASKIAGILKGKDNTTEPESGSNTAAAPSPKKADPEPTVAATNETTSSATPEVSSINSVSSTKSAEDEENTASTEDVSEETFAAANVTSVADESEPVVADDGKLSEAEIQKKQFEEASALENDEDDDEQMPSANTTVEEPAKDKKTVATKTFDANKPSETTTATTKSQPTDKLPAEPKPRSMDDDDDDEEESASTTTKKPVAGKKNAGSTTTTTEAPKGEEKDQIIEGDPDHSSALLPFASIIFALCFTLLL